MEKLTPRQKDTLDAIVTIMGRGYPPTQWELCAALNTKSTNGVRRHLSELVRKGRIQIVPSIARGIRVLKTA